MSNERFLAEQLENSALELESVREKLKEVTAQLGEAETALRFYADPKTYLVTLDKNSSQTLQNRLTGDYSEADNDPNTFIAGDRARRYFKQYAKL